MLVIIAEDASDKTKKHFRDKCAFYSVPIRFYSTANKLGKAIGKDFRVSVAVCDANLADAIMEKLEESE